MFLVWVNVLFFVKYGIENVKKNCFIYMKIKNIKLWFNIDVNLFSVYVFLIKIK